VCERIPYLILLMRQLSREPFGIRRSAGSEPPGKTPGSSQSNHPPKRYMSEPSGKSPGPPHTIRRSDTRASRRARCRTRHNPNYPPKRHERAVGQYAGPVSILTIRRSDTRAIRRASSCRGAACDPALKPQTAGTTDIEPNPLVYSL